MDFHFPPHAPCDVMKMMKDYDVTMYVIGI